MAELPVEAPMNQSIPGQGRRNNRGRRKSTPGLSHQEIAKMISSGEITLLELMARNNLTMDETQKLIWGIVAEYRVDLKPEFSDAVTGADLPPRISKVLEAAEKSIVKYRKVNEGVLLYLATK